MNDYKEIIARFSAANTPEEFRAAIEFGNTNGACWLKFNQWLEVREAWRESRKRNTWRAAIGCSPNTSGKSPEERIREGRD